MYAALVVAAIQKTVLSQCFQWVNDQGGTTFGRIHACTVKDGTVLLLHVCASQMCARRGICGREICQETKQIIRCLKGSNLRAFRHTLSRHTP